ncbi:MAG TPA: OadG-related small transporter subunit [Candidatus Cloacimonadota bacterium]|nr:OadG-related small transporter subunit [Candidatus Cloacimonadota bacterium]
MFQLDANTMENFLWALYVLVQGMGGVFLFMGVFYLLIWTLEKIFKQKARP